MSGDGSLHRRNHIMQEQDLHIVERLKKLLPAHRPEERAQLEANIKADGRVRDPILYWNDGKRNVVVDGMTRFEIVRGTAIPFKTEPVEFADYEAAELWILDHQLGRRNLLDPAAVRTIRGEMYNRLKRPDAGHGDQKSGGQNVPPITEAAEEVAKKAGVSARTVKRDGARVAALNKLTKAARDVAEKATDAEVKALARLDEAAQTAVARAVRVGQAKTIKDAIKQAGGGRVGRKESDGTDKPDGFLEVRAALSERKIKATDEQAAQLTEHIECLGDLLDSVSDGRQGLDHAIATGEVPEPTTDQLCERHNKTIEAFCRDLTKYVEANKPDVEWLDQGGRWEVLVQKVKNGLETIRSAKSVVCPACNGDGCVTCLQLGYLPKVMAAQVATK